MTNLRSVTTLAASQETVSAHHASHSESLPRFRRPTTNSSFFGTIGEPLDASDGSENDLANESEPWVDVEHQ